MPFNPIKSVQPNEFDCTIAISKKIQELSLCGCEHWTVKGHYKAFTQRRWFRGWWWQGWWWQWGCSSFHNTLIFFLQNTDQLNIQRWQPTSTSLSLFVYSWVLLPTCLIFYRMTDSHVTQLHCCTILYFASYLSNNLFER